MKKTHVASVTCVFSILNKIAAFLIPRIIDLIRVLTTFTVNVLDELSANINLHLIIPVQNT